MTQIARRNFLKFAATGAAGAAIVPALGATEASAATAIALTGRRIRLQWQDGADGWRLTTLQLRHGSGWRDVLTPSGRYGIWVATGSTAPSIDSVRRVQAGTHTAFLPEQATSSGDRATFTSTQPGGTLVATWTFDGDDLIVALTWTPTADGWYSIPSPTLATLGADDLAWGVVPGYWNAATLEPNDELTFRYQLGAPTVPLVTNEVSTTSLSAIAQSRAEHATLAVIADPSLARDPWAGTASTLSVWHVAMSLRALTGELSPTALYPVLGQQGSRLAAGQSVTATFRYVLSDRDWYDVNRHCARDVYRIGEYLRLATATDSLSHRINRMHDYIVSPQSQWHTWQYGGLTLGAESGKLSDVGAMWMMDALTADPIIRNDRLPYARNFKLAQQQTDPGPFQGAALGEYFKNDGWVSELVWANINTPDYVSPIFTTFYALADMGNIALFEPGDAEIRDRIRLAADTLLRWQKDDGSFDIGYLRADPDTKQYPELTDYRATWYGFVAAYRVLGDRKYLDAARRGADWFLEHAVATGNYLGVCDDSRLVTDFAVIFAAQALLDLYELTHVAAYRDAAIEAARVYTLHIYTHPTPTTAPKTFHGLPMQDWQTSQVGLNFEHAGYYGSANGAGPILLSSHAGAFVRFHELTGDQHFLDLARAAARGRDAFVGVSSGIPSYYWSAGNGGSAVYPWHGWWHIGWVTDYLIAEAHLRTRGKISFPHGFCTAKVGSHRPYGFAAGQIWDQPVELWMPRTLLSVDEPNVDWLVARTTNGKRLFVIALNQRGERTTATLTLNPRGVEPGRLATWRRWRAVTGAVSSAAPNEWSVSLDANGVAVLSVDLILADDPQGPELRSFGVAGPYLAPTVSWSYFATVTSWVQWRVTGTDTWTDTDPIDGYAPTETLDLSSVPAPAVVQIRIATRLPDGTVGYSPATDWTVPKVVVPDGPDIALGRPVDVSSTYTAAYTGDKAVDGNTTDMASRWLSAVDDAQPTITVHLAAATTPRLVRVYSGPNAAQVVVAFTVQARLADGTWTTIGSVEGNTASTTDVPVDSPAADQMRLVITGRSRDPIDVARIFEVEIYDRVR